MTRSDFLNNVNSFDDLIEFIFYHDIEDDVFPDGQTICRSDLLDAVIEADIKEYCSYDIDWRTLSDILEDIRMSIVGRFEYIMSEGILSYRGLTEEDLATFKESAIAAIDRDDGWDDEDEALYICDDFNTDSLMNECHDKLVEIEESNNSVTLLTDNLFECRSKNSIIINENICGMDKYLAEYEYNELPF